MAELRWGAATHAGQIRPDNEDSVLAIDGMFVVADGMGGHEAGEVASQLAIERLRQDLEDAELPDATDVVESIAAANGDIYRAAIANPAQHGMGTTLTAIAVIGDRLAGRGAPNIDDNDPATDTGVVPAEPDEALILANVGDSRTYLYRHQRLRRVTIDHSYVQELVATGHLTEAEARIHPRRNIVTRALGIEPDVRIDWWTLPLIRGDRFLLCSDGLVDEVEDTTIAAILQEESDPQSAADRLVRAANEAGGRDNVTVIVLDVIEGDDPPDPTLEVDVVPVFADQEADPTPAGTLELDADAHVATDGAVPVVAAGGPPPGRRRKRVKRFVIAFAAAAVLCVLFVLFAVWARSGYYLTYGDDDEVLVFHGRTGGVLWFDPTLEVETGKSRDELEDDVADEIDDEPRFDSLDGALEFVRDAVTTTTTTTTTTTVAPATTSAPATTRRPATTTANASPTTVP